MRCLRCGHCCTHYIVAIVKDPSIDFDANDPKSYDNITTHEGNGPCPHLRGDKPGEYICSIHDKPWYRQTPCYAYGQIEDNPNRECRTGKHILGKQNGV